MENIKEKYKLAFNNLISDKLFVNVVILIAILSFGFTITNLSIGIDDTCLDRYYSGNNQYVNTSMLTSGRWGGYFLYNILGIDEFTPFWTEMLAAILVLIWAIMWCVFLKKELENFKIPNSAYTVLASILISFPIINECFIYQNSILSVILGNILVSISAILTYEVIYNKSIKLRGVLVSILLIILGISMYESCAQVYILAICIIGGLNCYKEKNNIKLKKIIKYIVASIILIGSAMILNSIIVKVIYTLGVPASEAAEKEINWGSYGILESIQMLSGYMNEATIRNTKYFPVLVFNASVVIGFIISVIQSYKKQNVLILLLYVGAVLANFAISILQLKGVMYRTCTSWGLFVAIVFTIFYIYMSKYKLTQILSGIFIIILVLQQSRYLNQMFYNDYIRYQRDLHIAYELIDDLETSHDISKPIVIAGWPKKAIGKDGAQVNSLSVLWWGKKAFDDNGAEFIKFLNSLGYNFKRPNDEQYEKGTKEAEGMTSYPQEGSIKELENCIVINF